ncbi:MAG: universal stress protein [Coriobacteriales bacterium]|nr:universal stress protein [Coriobacteriales bacterium]
MMRSVLIPVDFTRDDDLVVKFAEGLRGYGVERVVLGNVIEASGMEGPVIARSIDDARDKLSACGKPLEDAGFMVEYRIATGEPGTELVTLAAENRADAIVAGTHGSNAIRRLLRGSVTEDLVHHADRPTMLVRYAPLSGVENPSALGADFGRSIVLPTDFSASATRALLWVLDLPRGTASNVLILHVLDPGLAGARLTAAEEAARARMAALCEMASDGGVTARCTVRQGDPVAEILREVHERVATGIVTGSHGRGALGDAVMGSTSLALIRQASLPVMIVP